MLVKPFEELMPEIQLPHCAVVLNVWICFQMYQEIVFSIPFLNGAVKFLCTLKNHNTMVITLMMATTTTMILSHGSLSM